MMPKNETPQTNVQNSSILNKIIDLATQTNMYFKDAPNHEKHGLCKTIRNKIYEDVYVMAVKAYKRRNNKSAVENLDIAHEELRMLYYLYFKQGYFGYKKGRNKPEEVDALHRFTTINKMNDEIGRMIGGWMKSINSKEKF